MTFIKNSSPLPKLRLGLASLAILLSFFALSHGAFAGDPASDPGSAFEPGRGGGNPTPSPTPGATPRATPSPTPRATPSPTPRATPSPTPGATPSPTPAATPSPTPSATPSPTPSATPSPTPGATPSPTPGATPSPTPGATPSPTPGATPSPTPGATPSPTPGASPSPTPGATPTPTPTGNEVRIRGTLVGAAFNGMIPSAEVEFRQESDGERRLEIELRNINLPAGTTLGVLVDNVQVGTIRLDGGLGGELRLRTDDGQAVPVVNLRTRVVITSPDGATVLAGSFSNLPPGPSPTPTPQPGQEFRIEARLAGASINGLVPKGHAKFRVRDDGRRKLNVEVEKVNLFVGTILNVLVDGVKVGEIAVGPALENELELDTNNGQFVPQVGANTTVVVTSQQGATILSGAFNTTVAAISGNDIDNSQFFVEQQYRDFFDREADDSGLAFWKNQIAQCGAGGACAEGARINTSGAFFLSIEFQETGYLLYRFNKSSFGQMPRRNEFLVDMQSAARGVVVGQLGWESQLEANKRALAEAWVNRPAFRAAFDGMTNAQFVDALFARAGVTPAGAERDTLVAGLNAGQETRATVLRKVAENDALRRNERNRAFVLMQYFGYLHRDPDDIGFNFWLTKLNNHGGDFHAAEMVKAFLDSGEYRGRFQW